MEDSTTFFFITTVFILVLTITMAILKFYQRKKNEFGHLVELFMSLLLMDVCSYYFGARKTPIMVLSVLPWPWVLKSFGVICQDIAKGKLFKKWHVWVVAGGALLSISLASLSFDLPYILIPYIGSIVLVGGTMLFDTFFYSQRRSFTPIQYMTLSIYFVFLISRFTYLSGDGPLFDFSSSLLFCTLLFPLYAEAIFEKQEEFLENALNVRNKQLFSHSSFSEFRILSAGVSHEINNALTIINAKIEHMIRRPQGLDEKNLRVILHAADRIGKSMRGLREFIYPNEQSEDLSLEEIVDHVLMLYGQRLKNHDVAVNTHNLSGKYLRGHRTQLEQVFLSLLNNAVESIDKMNDKWIEISGKEINDQIQVTFQDSGRGIGAGVEAMLYDPFYSIEENVDNGIRLVLAKDIIEKHGGSFHYLETNPNTTFLIELPVNDHFEHREVFH